MNHRYELGLASYDILPNGVIVVAFDDNLTFTFTNETSLDQECTNYDAQVIEQLRQYITCYCATFGGNNIEGKKFIFDLEEPNGNIVRIV